MPSAATIRCGGPIRRNVSVARRSGPSRARPRPQRRGKEAAARAAQHRAEISICCPRGALRVGQGPGGWDPGRRLGEQAPAFLLAQVGALAAARFAERLAPLDLTPAHAAALRVLALEAGISQRALAERLGLSPSRLVGLLDHLEGRGLVQRRSDTDDRRNHALHLTDAGTEMLRALGRIAAAHQASLCRSLDPAEMAQLVALLDRLAGDQGLRPGFGQVGGRRSKPTTAAPPSTDAFAMGPEALEGQGSPHTAHGQAHRAGAENFAERRGHLAGGGSKVSDACSSSWSVGHAAADITPDAATGRTYLAGYGVRLASGVRDPLEAHAVALRCGASSVVVVTLDLLGLFHDDGAVLQHAVCSALGEGAPPVVVTCTHTHAAPDLLGQWGPDELSRGVDDRYRERVVDAAADAAVRAWRQARPARLHSAEARVDGVAHNARDLDLLDPVLTLLSWTTPQEGTDAPVLQVLHFACHPEALGPMDRRCSADLAGEARRRLQAASGCPCVFWQGALGGMVGPNTRTGEEGGEALVRLGGTLGNAAAALAADLRPEACALALVRHEVALPQDNPRFEAARAAGVIRRPVLGMTLLSSAGVLRVGPYLFHLAPGEVLPAVARRWDRQSRADLPDLRPRVFGLCDDEIGYIIREEDFTPGRYEESVSLGPRTAALLGATYASLRQELAGR